MMESHNELHILACVSLNVRMFLTVFHLF